jgi:hypothetical protein
VDLLAGLLMRAARLRARWALGLVILLAASAALLAVSELGLALLTPGL